MCLITELYSESLVALFVDSFTLLSCQSLFPWIFVFHFEHLYFVSFTDYPCLCHLNTEHSYCSICSSYSMALLSGQSHSHLGQLLTYNQWLSNPYSKTLPVGQEFIPMPENHIVKYLFLWCFTGISDWNFP
jgi:hypothetical protein